MSKWQIRVLDDDLKISIGWIKPAKLVASRSNYQEALKFGTYSNIKVIDKKRKTQFKTDINKILSLKQQRSVKIIAFYTSIKKYHIL